MSEYYYRAFLTKHHKYLLIDGEGDIRGSAQDIEGIVLLKVRCRWGKIHRCKFDGKTLKIGEEVK